MRVEITKPLGYALYMADGSNPETKVPMVVSQKEVSVGRRRFLKLLTAGAAALGFGALIKGNQEGAQRDSQKAEGVVRDYLNKQGETPKNLPPRVEVIDQEVRFVTPTPEPTKELWNRPAVTPIIPK